MFLAEKAKIINLSLNLIQGLKRNNLLILSLSELLLAINFIRFVASYSIHNVPSENVFAFPATKTLSLLFVHSNFPFLADN